MNIEIKNLEKVFRTDSVETVALNNISLTINDGEFVAIMGPSGCGKSTLLNILGLLDSPTSGSYLLDGREVASLKENERADYRKGKIGFIFQAFNLIDMLNVRDNIMLPLNCLGLGKSEKEKKVAAILDRMGIAHRSSHYPSQLSGGQQQRVAIASVRLVVSGIQKIFKLLQRNNPIIDKSQNFIQYQQITFSGS